MISGEQPPVSEADPAGPASRRLPPRPAQLLDPHQQVVGFLGRKDALAHLAEWCDAGAGPLRLVTGNAGVGKTRLAVEFAARATGLGWSVSWVADGQESDAAGALGSSSGRRLLILDHAGTRRGLLPLLAALARTRSEDVRVLLLARSAAPWWNRLRVEDAAVAELTWSAVPDCLSLQPALDDGIPPAEMLAGAAAAYASRLSRPVPATAPTDPAAMAERPVFDLHAAALASMLSGRGDDASGLAPGAVLAELLGFEQRCWQDRAVDAGLAGTRGGTPSAQLRQVIAAAVLLGTAADLDAQCLFPPGPAGQSLIDLASPDRLARMQAVRELASSASFAATCLAGLTPDSLLRVVIQLADACREDPASKDLLAPAALTAVEQEIAGVRGPSAALIGLIDAIALPSQILGDAAVTVCSRILDLLPADSPPAIRAYWLNYHGILLGQAGRRAEAAKALEEAIDIRRTLPEPHLDHNRYALSTSLHNLAHQRWQQDERVKAVDAAEEGIATLRQVVSARPGQYRAELANQLRELSEWHREQSDYARAAVLAEEAVAIGRELAASMPSRHSAALQRELSNLAGLYHLRDRKADATAVYEESVRILRDLARRRPSRYGPQLAISLGQLGIWYGEQKRVPDAVAAAEEGIAILRPLVASDPARYLPMLGAALNNIGIWYAEAGQNVHALAATEEAVDVLRELAADQPGRLDAELAGAISNLGLRYARVRRRADALREIEAATEMWRELASKDPAAYRGKYAQSLRQLGASSAGVGQKRRARELVQQAAKIRAEAAVDLGWQRSELDAEPAAAPVSRTADGTAAAMAGLARALGTLGLRLSDAGRRRQARKAHQEAVGILRAAVAAEPAEHGADLARSLNNLAHACWADGQPKHALPLAEESAALLRPMAAADPGYRLDLLRALTGLRTALIATGRRPEGQEVANEIGELRRQLD